MVPASACGADPAAGEVAEEGQVALDCVEEMREGAGADVKEGLGGDGADGTVDVDVPFFGGLEGGFESVEVGDDVVGFGATTEEVQDRLGGLVMGTCCSRAKKALR